jgi:hypothetical protein
VRKRLAMKLYSRPGLENVRKTTLDRVYDRISGTYVGKEIPYRGHMAMMARQFFRNANLRAPYLFSSKPSRLAERFPVRSFGAAIPLAEPLYAR